MWRDQSSPQSHSRRLGWNHHLCCCFSVCLGKDIAWSKFLKGHLGGRVTQKPGLSICELTAQTASLGIVLCSYSARRMPGAAVGTNSRGPLRTETPSWLKGTAEANNTFQQ